MNSNSNSVLTPPAAPLLHLRRVLDEIDTTTSSSNKAFWPVTIVIAIVFLAGCLWYWMCGYSFVHRQGNSDDEYRNAVMRRRQREAERGKVCPEKRRRTILQSFKRCQTTMTIKQEDLQNDQVTLRTTSTSTTDSQSTRSVPNCCAVCLSEYEAGDEIVWSSNQQCSHVFHQDCLMDWFTHNKDNLDPVCPICRQQFTDLKEYAREKRIKWAPGQSFNFDNISLR